MIRIRFNQSPSQNPRRTDRLIFLLFRATP